MIEERVDTGSIIFLTTYHVSNKEEYWSLNTVYSRTTRMLKVTVSSVKPYDNAGDISTSSVNTEQFFLKILCP